MNRRDAWIAGIANLVVPPLGHLYAGAPLRGFAIWLAVLVVAVALLCVARFPLGSGGLVLIVAAFVALETVLVIDAARVACSLRPNRARRWWNRWFVYAAATCIFWAIGEGVDLICRRGIVEALSVQSNAMAPTLTLGDKVLIDRSARKRIPKRGDIVAFSSPNDERWQLLRVVGLPGETIKVSGVEVSVDGKPLAEPYARYADKEPAPALDHSTAGREVRLAEDELFLLGDNRDRSYDGRVNGAIHRTYIKGIARTIYFSWNGDSVRVRWRRIGAIG